MHEVQGRERVLQLRKRSTHRNGVFTEARQRRSADFHDAHQFVGRIGAIVPEMRMWMRAAGRPRIRVGDEVHAGFRRPGQNGFEFRVLVGAYGKLPITVVDRRLVPHTDIDRVGLRQIRDAGGVQDDPGMRIIHDRHRFGGCVRERTGGEVMFQPQRMAGLVRRELPRAGQGHGQHRIVAGCDAVAGDVGREQGGGDQVVLSAAQRSQRDVALDDLAGARVRDRRPVRPSMGSAPSGSMSTRKVPGAQPAA